MPSHPPELTDEDGNPIPERRYIRIHHGPSRRRSQQVARIDYDPTEQDPEWLAAEITSVVEEQTGAGWVWCYSFRVGETSYSDSYRVRVDPPPSEESELAHMAALSEGSSIGRLFDAFPKVVDSLSRQNAGMAEAL